MNKISNNSMGDMKKIKLLLIFIICITIICFELAQLATEAEVGSIHFFQYCDKKEFSPKITEYFMKKKSVMLYANYAGFECSPYYGCISPDGVEKQVQKAIFDNTDQTWKMVPVTIKYYKKSKCQYRGRYMYIYPFRSYEVTLFSDRYNNIVDVEAKIENRLKDWLWLSK